MKVVQLCMTLWDPIDYTVHGILQARIMKWVAFRFSRGSSQPGNRTQVSCIAGRFSTSWATSWTLLSTAWFSSLTAQWNNPGNFYQMLMLDPPFSIPDWKWSWCSLGIGFLKNFPNSSNSVAWSENHWLRGATCGLQEPLVRPCLFHFIAEKIFLHGMVSLVSSLKSSYSGFKTQAQ